MKHKWVNRKDTVKRDDGSKHVTEWIECSKCGKRPDTTLTECCK